MKSYLKNCTNHLLKISKEGKSVIGLKMLFGPNVAEMGSLSSFNCGVKY